MFYNTRTQQILNRCPQNGYLENGTLVQGLDIADSDTQKSCGILPIVSDLPSQPDNSVEDVSKREIIIENGGVKIVRTWIESSPIISVPHSVSARQIRLWLLDNNISLASVESAIESIEDIKLKEKAKVEWEFAPYIERNHRLIQTIGASLGLTNDQIDQGFIDASKL